MEAGNGRPRHIQVVSDQGSEAAELRRPIGEIFVELGFVSRAELESALDTQRERGGQIGEILVDQGSLTRIDLASALAEHWEPRPFADDDFEAPDSRAVPVEQTVELESIDRTLGDSSRLLAGLDRVADRSGVEARLGADSTALVELEARLRAEQDAALGEYFAAIDGRLDRMERRLGELQEELQVETGSLSGRLDELFGLRHADAQVSRVTSERFSARLDDLAAGQVEPEAVDRLTTEVAELTRRVDELDAIGDESAGAVERAILDGLADLGKQLTARATKGGKPKKRLRRSIASLAVAVAAADARLAKLRAAPRDR